VLGAHPRRDHLVVDRQHSGQLQLAQRLHNLMPLHGRCPVLQVGGAAGRSGRKQPPARSPGSRPPALPRAGAARHRVARDVPAARLGRQRPGVGRLDGVEPGLGNCREDVDELAIAVIVAGEPPADLRQRWRQVRGSQLRNGRRS
jgi:hypothetical protein